MKKFLFLFLIILSFSAFSATGVINVLEAPLLKRPSLKAPVIEIKKQGEKIFIHDKHVPPSSYRNIYSEHFDQGEVVDGWDKKGFFKVLDSSSSVAYIEKRYVKIIYNDIREQATSIKPYEKDPTDYRLEEPLPEDYPLYDPRQRRASLALVTGPSRETSYAYTNAITRDTQGSRLGITGSYTRKVSDDPYNRFYFGGQFHFQYQNAEYLFEDGSFSEESFGQLGAGPIISYNFFRTENYRLTVSGGLTLNFHRALVYREKPSDEIAEERLFEGFSFTPKFKTQVVRSNIFPHFDLMLGTEVQFNTAHTLSPKTSPVVNELWNPNEDGYTFPTGGVFAIFFGIQSSY